MCTKTEAKFRARRHRRCRAGNVCARASFYPGTLLQVASRRRADRPAIAAANAAVAAASCHHPTTAVCPCTMAMTTTMTTTMYLVEMITTTFTATHDRPTRSRASFDVGGRPLERSAHGSGAGTQRTTANCLMPTSNRYLASAHANANACAYANARAYANTYTNAYANAPTPPQTRTPTSNINVNRNIVVVVACDSVPSLMPPLRLRC